MDSDLRIPINNSHTQNRRRHDSIISTRGKGSDSMENEETESRHRGDFKTVANNKSFIISSLDYTWYGMQYE